MKKWLEDFAQRFPDRTLEESGVYYAYDYRLDLTEKGKALAQQYDDSDERISRYS